MSTLKRLIDDDPIMGAWFSPELDPLYRYALWRIWDKRKPLLLVSMLNPSTADHRKDDPSVGRVTGFAKRDGFGGFILVNAYAYRSTKPKVMFATAEDPDGPMNRSAKYQAANLARDTNNGRDPVALMAHGAHGGEGGLKTFDILHTARCDIRCLGVTKAGHPKHPLYIPGDAPMVPWAPAMEVQHDQPHPTHAPPHARTSPARPATDAQSIRRRARAGPVHRTAAR